MRPLIYIGDWDFNWQGSYTFTQPVPLPTGTRIDMVAAFDNSAVSRVRAPESPEAGALPRGPVGVPSRPLPE